MANPGLLNQYENNPQVLYSIKLLQLFLTVGTMIVPAFIFPKALQQQPVVYLKIKVVPKMLFVLLAILLIFVSSPLISWLVEINEQVVLPLNWAALEASMKAAEVTAGKLTIAFLSGSSTTDLLVNLLVVALFPAIAEELLFRGVLQQFLVGCFKQVHFAIILSAIFFSAFHGQFYGFVPRMILGIALGYLFASSGSIWVSIIAHFVNNALGVCIVFFGWDKSAALLSESFHFSTMVTVLSAVFSIGILYFTWAKRTVLSIKRNGE